MCGSKVEGGATYCSAKCRQRKSRADRESQRCDSAVTPSKRNITPVTPGRGVEKVTVTVDGRAL